MSLSGSPLPSRSPSSSPSSSPLGMGVDSADSGGATERRPVASVSSSPMPSHLPGAASLVEQLDKTVMVCMRDGKSYIGTLRSFDQYANLVLEQTVERIVVDSTFGDVPIGLFLARGENVMMLGEIDRDREGSRMSERRLQQVSAEEIERARTAEEADRSAFRRREKLEWPGVDDYL